MQSNRERQRSPDAYARKNVEVHGEPDEEYLVKLGVDSLFIRYGDNPWMRVSEREANVLRQRKTDLAPRRPK